MEDRTSGGIGSHGFSRIRRVWVAGPSSWVNGFLPTGSSEVASPAFPGLAGVTQLVHQKIGSDLPDFFPSPFGLSLSDSHFSLNLPKSLSLSLSISLFLPSRALCLSLLSFCVRARRKKERRRKNEEEDKKRRRKKSRLCRQCRE
jgi:hypothetical protein